MSGDDVIGALVVERAAGATAYDDTTGELLDLVAGPAGVARNRFGRATARGANAPRPADAPRRDEDELREHVRANLARFKVPREIVFLDELPRNATGKVLKRELAGWDQKDDTKDDEARA